MTDTATPKPVRSVRRETLLWGGGIAAAVAVVVALPLWLDGRGLEDPAADAEATYRELLVRIEARRASADPPDSDSLGAVDSANRRRDLFAPVTKRRPDLAAARARRKRPKLPTLSSVLIDGPSRQAVLDGRIFAIGEQVGDYRVDAIESDTVTLRRDGSTHLLTMGGK
jgi:hypothetical protein